MTEEYGRKHTDGSRSGGQPVTNDKDKQWIRCNGIRCPHSPNTCTASLQYQAQLASQPTQTILHKPQSAAEQSFAENANESTGQERQPTQSDVRNFLPKMMDDWCAAVAKTWGQGSQTHNVARDGVDIVRAALRQPTQSDAVGEALEREIEAVTLWLDGGCSSWGTPASDIRKIIAALQEQSK